MYIAEFVGGCYMLEKVFLCTGVAPNLVAPTYYSIIVI
jgi:hypothetical protein